MSISSITRDYGIVPSIVRIQSSDTLAVCASAGYITAQDANIKLANNGEFTWLASDSVLVSASDSNQLFMISSNFSSLVLVNQLNAGVANAITAHAGGGQTSAVLLTASVNRVTVVATAADSVKLPSALPGAQIVVINASANALDVYPQSGEVANENAGTNAAVVQVARKTYVYYCALAGQWSALISG